MPLSTPRRVTRLGVAVFADTGTVYGAREPLDGAVWDTGVGAGVFLQAPAASACASTSPAAWARARGCTSRWRDVLTRYGCVLSARCRSRMLSAVC